MVAAQSLSVYEVGFRISGLQTDLYQFQDDGSTVSQRSLTGYNYPILYADPGAPGPGDFNGDGIVDAADYTLWRDGLGSSYTPADYDTWKANFGNVAGAGALDSPAVPEPSTAALLVIGCVVA